DLAHELAVAGEFQELGRRRAVGRAGGVAALEHQQVVGLGVEGDARHLAEVHVGRRIEGVGPLERDFLRRLGQGEGGRERQGRRDHNAFHPNSSQPLPCAAAWLLERGVLREVVRRGGRTPPLPYFRSTCTRVARATPSAPFTPKALIASPGLMLSRSMGKLPITWTSGGTMMWRVPPGYDTTSSRPWAPLVTVCTVALVMVVLGCCIGRLPSPPLLPGSKMRSSIDLPVSASMLVLAVATKLPGLIDSMSTGRVATAVQVRDRGTSRVLPACALMVRWSAATAVPGLA